MTVTINNAAGTRDFIVEDVRRGMLNLQQRPMGIYESPEWQACAMPLIQQELYRRTIDIPIALEGTNRELGASFPDINPFDTTFSEPNTKSVQIVTHADANFLSTPIEFDATNTGGTEPQIGLRVNSIAESFFKYLDEATKIFSQRLAGRTSHVFADRSGGNLTNPFDTRSRTSTIGRIIEHFGRFRSPSSQWAWVNSSDNAGIRTLDEYSLANQSGTSEQIIGGRLRTRDGLNWYVDPRGMTHEAGTAGPAFTVPVAGSSNDTTITLRTSTAGNLKMGDIITFGGTGVTTSDRVVASTVNFTANTNTMVTLTQSLGQAIPTTSTVTRLGDHNNSFIFAGTPIRYASQPFNFNARVEGNEEGRVGYFIDYYEDAAQIYGLAFQYLHLSTIQRSKLFNMGYLELAVLYPNDIIRVVSPTT